MKNKKSFSIKFVIICICFLLILIAIFMYGRRLSSMTNEMIMSDTIKGVTEETSNNLAGVVKGRVDAVCIAAKMYSKTFSESEDNTYLFDQLQNEAGFFWLRYFDTDGHDVWNDGLSSDFSSREYFKQGIAGKSGVAVVNHSEKDGKDLLAYYYPVKKNGIICGVMVGFSEKNHLDNNMSSVILDYSVPSYLVDGNGDIIYSNLPADTNRGSIFDYLLNVKASDRSSLKSAIEGRRNLGFSYLKDGEEGKAYIAEIENTNWMVIQFYPLEATLSIVKNSNNESDTIFGVLLFAIIIMVIYFFGVYKKRIQDEIEKESLKEKDESRNELEKAKCEAEKSSRAKSEFLYNMSHDLRTPLNAIVGFAELAKNSDDLEKTKEYVKKIDTSSQNLIQLVNDVLEISKIENGAIKVEKTIGFPSQGEDKIIPIFAQDIEKKKLNFTYEIEQGIPPVYWDKEIFYRIVTNLLSNAIKYTPEGGNIHFSSSTQPGTDDDHCILKIQVSDTGIGMSEDFVKKAFEPFSRERSSNSSGIQGTGLGLRIVYALVDIMGGRITVDSQLGKGTTFTVLTELEYVKDYVPENAAVEEGDYSILLGKRILLAEDNELNAEIAIELLEEKGFLIEHATDGEKCVEMFAESPMGYYDLILMDIQMPIMDGYQATRIIRDFDDMEKAKIPIIAMTANAFDEDRKAALRAGMNDHVAKPINMKALLSCIAKNI